MGLSRNHIIAIALVILIILVFILYKKENLYVTDKPVYSPTMSGPTMNMSESNTSMPHPRMHTSMNMSESNTSMFGSTMPSPTMPGPTMPSPTMPGPTMPDKMKSPTMSMSESTSMHDLSNLQPTMPAPTMNQNNIINVILSTIEGTAVNCINKDKKDKIESLVRQLDENLSNAQIQQIKTEADTFNIPEEILRAYYLLNNPANIEIYKNIIDNLELSQEELSCTGIPENVCALNKDNTKSHLFLIRKINDMLINYTPVIKKAKQNIIKNLATSLKNCTEAESKNAENEIKLFVNEYNKLLQNLYSTLYL